MQNSYATNISNAKLLGLFLLEVVPWRFSVKKLFLKLSQNVKQKISSSISIIIKTRARKRTNFFEKKDSVMDVSLELLGNFSGNPFCTTSSNVWFCFFTLKQRVCSFLTYTIVTLMEKNRKT